MSHARRARATLVLAALLIVGCGPATTPTPSPTGTVPSASPTATAMASPVAPSGSPATSSVLPTPSGSPAGASPPPSLPALVDRSLLALLPTAVDGLPVVEDVVGERQQAIQLEAGHTIHGYAAAVVGDAGENVASISLVTPAFPADVASFARTWAQEFDKAACEANGGAALTTTSIIGRYRVDVSRCAGGAVVYHAILGGRAVLSILELGPRELGRRVIEELPSAGG